MISPLLPIIYYLNTARNGVLYYGGQGYLHWCRGNSDKSLLWVMELLRVCICVSVFLCEFFSDRIHIYFPISADVVRGINNRQLLTVLPNMRLYGTKCRHSIRSAHLTSHLHLCTTVKYIKNFQLLLLLLLSASTSSPSSSSSSSLSSSSSSSPSLPCQ